MLQSWPLRTAATGNHELLDGGASQQMLVNNAIEHLWRAAAIPNAFGVDDDDWPTLADIETGAFAANDLAVFLKLEFLQSSTQVLPRLLHLFRRCAFAFFAVVTKQDVATTTVDPQFLGFAARRVDWL